MSFLEMKFGRLIFKIKKFKLTNVLLAFLALFIVVLFYLHSSQNLYAGDQYHTTMSPPER